MLFCCFAHHASYTSVISKKIYVYTKTQLGLEAERGVCMQDFKSHRILISGKTKFPLQLNKFCWKACAETQNPNSISAF